MKTLIIFDSYFGNTEKVAETIAENIPNSQLIHASNFKEEYLDNLDLLIVGSPTRAFNPSEKTTRFLNSLPQNSLEGIDIAAFDTRMDLDKAPSKILKFLGNIFGFAAEPIAKKLIKKGGTQVLEPIGFNVKDTEGPLEKNEIEKAKVWVTTLSF